MKELFYFSNSKLLIKAEYFSDLNSIKYSTHRKTTGKERSAVEQYILTTFALKTQYFESDPSSLEYSGVDVRLKKEMKLLRLKKVLKVMAVHEQEATEHVTALINNSMSTYYFERIGDTILEMRKQVSDKHVHKFITIEKTKKDIEQLIEAYNNYTERKTSIDKVLPRDLIEFFN